MNLYMVSRNLVVLYSTAYFGVAFETCYKYTEKADEPADFFIVCRKPGALHPATNATIKSLM